MMTFLLLQLSLMFSLLTTKTFTADAFGVQSNLPTLKRTSNTQLYFGIPSFGSKNNKEDGETKDEEKKISASGLFQLITAGMGSPFLGDYEGVDEETGKLMFSLEANNLVDEKGESRQTKAAYFESGWVSDEDQEKERKKKEKGGFKFW